MDKDEVICISSDDEDKIEELHSKQNKPLSQNKTDTGSSTVNTNVDDDKKKDINKQKRKISEVDGTSNEIDKKIKTELREELNGDLAKTNVKENEIKLQKDMSMPMTNNIVKPQLIIKEKKSISPLGQDVFPMFISLCLQKKREPAMETIVNKLKRRYEQMDPVRAKSDSFQNFLNSKRNDILNTDNAIYQHIKVVMDEMKSKTSKASKFNASKDNTYKSGTSNDSSSSSGFINSEHVENSEEDYIEDTMDPNTRRKFKQIVKVMKACTKKIKALEEAEVDFDDEDNSNYIKLERYKERMVQLYVEYCNITGDNIDAGRSYLRPKHLNTTQIVSVDQAITNFINAKITKRNKLKKNGRFTDDLIFPDYRDILKCVSNCNDKNKLGLDERKQSQIAKKAFTDLGEYLQRARRNDYWDTFSLFLENQADDPALKDQKLAEKLHSNRMVGEQKLTQIFQEYVKKQEEMKDLSVQDKANTENDDDGDNVESNDEDENSEGDEDNDNIEAEDENDNIEAEDENDNIEAEDENDKIEAENENDKNIENNANNDQCENYNKNEDVSKSASIENTKTSTTEDEDNTKHSVTHVCKKKSVKDVIPNISEGICKDIQSKGSIVLPENVIEESSPATRSETVIVQPLPTSNKNNTTDNIEDEIVAVTSLDSGCDIKMDENKPLLRVRSFAKPPTTWEDNKQRLQATEGTTIKEVIDLTTEIPKTHIEVPKLAIQVGKRVVPLKKTYKAVVIPANLAGKSIISVKNITNNYVKVNTRDIRANTSSNSKTNHIVTSSPSVRQLLDVGSVNTIIHLPHVSNKQNINNGGKNSETTQKQTIVRFVIPAKQVEQSNPVELPIRGTCQKEEK